MVMKRGAKQRKRLPECTCEPPAQVSRQVGGGVELGGGNDTSVSSGISSECYLCYLLVFISVLQNHPPPFPSSPSPPLPDLLDSPCITSLGASPPPEVPQGARRAMRSPSRGPRRPKECVWGAREGSALVFAAAERINEESLLAEGEVRKGKEGRSSAWGGGGAPT